MASTMRGLTQFIADIRGARVRELEEKRVNKEMANVRKKFKEGSLDGYQKKKYVAKIIFTYILGYPVDIGHMEAVNLISSHKYSEKQIGYLAVTLLMHENSDLLRLVVNSLKKDLYESSEINNCLALHAIANVGGQEMAEALVDDVHRLLISPTSISIVKKKAALTLLRLYRKHPEVVPISEWADRISSLLDDPDLGVVNCVTSLIMAMAQDHMQAFAGAYQKATNRLRRLLLEHEYPATHVYYRVPAPWLQVKLLRLLQYYPPSQDGLVLTTLQEVLPFIMSQSAEQTRNVQHNNAQNAILFEAISLSIHLDPSSSLVAEAVVLLARFISSKETNVRYLGLDTMAHLAAGVGSLDTIKRYQGTVILSLRDKDISVRRRALDLLYSMCDIANAELIVGELLQYLRIADYGLREEMVLKIAILTEKYATSYKWYIDTILQLINAAGDHVGDEVWYRIIQITTNTDDLQEYAARVALAHLRSPSGHESLMKVGGYILGEYGHLIANEPGYSPSDQFMVLHSKSQFCSASTRALLLTTYLKWVNVFPEIKSHLLNVFDRYRHVLDSDLQQRACEYLALASRPADDELLQNVCEEMPPFPARGSAIIGRLNKKISETGDRRVWVYGGKDLNESRETPSRRPTLTGEATAESPTQAAPRPTNGTASSVEHGIHVDRWFQRLCYTDDGVLYEDLQVQIGLKSEYHNHLGRIALYVGNKISTPLTSFAVTLDIDEPDALSIQSTKFPPPVIAPRTQIHQLLDVECKSPFKTPPRLTISFVLGTYQTITLRLPVVISKFFDPVKLGQSDFFERWKLIGGAPREVQSVFTIRLDDGGHLDVHTNRKVLAGLHFSLLDDIDPIPLNLVGAGVLHTSGAGKVGCLFRLEPNQDAKLCRLTVRSTSEDVAQEVTNLIKIHLEEKGLKKINPS